MSDDNEQDFPLSDEPNDAGPNEPKRRGKGRGTMGRPQIDIDPKKVQAMSAYGCTAIEIAAVLGCSAKTLDRRFHAELEAGRNARNGTLRVMQFKLAQKSAAMAIFLGKNYLQQSDRFEFSGKDGGPIELAPGRVDLKRLSTEQLREFSDLIEIAAVTESDQDGAGDPFPS